MLLAGSKPVAGAGVEDIQVRNSPKSGQIVTRYQSSNALAFKGEVDRCGKVI
jgi:hypothetical protein